MNEQPLLADLFEVPVAADAGLLCTGLRALDGKRPVFIDHSDNVFFFPYRLIRFVEIPGRALSQHEAQGGRDAPGWQPRGGDEIGEDRRLPPPAVIEAEASTTPDAGDEIDEDLLRRIRDV